jgi:hypothetical protein
LNNETKNIYINTFILLLGYELNVSLDLANEHFKKMAANKVKENKIIVYLDDAIKNE